LPYPLEPEPTCRWCGHLLTPEDAATHRHVCPNCARLLTDAGLPDEEIYGPPKEQDATA
jgi:hypothetical protein